MHPFVLPVYLIKYFSITLNKKMPEIIVKYKDKRALNALHDFAKYFDFEIKLPDPSLQKEKQINLNGITVIPGDSSVDTSDLNKIFTGKNINSTELRKKAWQRK